VRPASRLAAAGAPAVLLAALGVWLWQSAAVPPNVAVPAARSVFTAAQIDRAQAYRGPQYLLALVILAAGPVGAVAWARWGTVPGARLLPDVAHAGVLAAATAAAAGVAALAPEYATHVRAADACLDLRSAAAWGRDAAVALAVTAAAAGVAYAVVFAVARRARRPALVAGGVAWAAVALLVALQPVVLDPLLLGTHPVTDPATRRIVARAERLVGARPASVTVSDASSRTTEENAFADGLGPTERVVLDDTALRHAAPATVEALVAHELAHVRRMHTLKGVLWFGVLGVPALSLVLAAAGRLAERRRLGGVRDAAAAPLVVAGALVAAALLTPVQNAISRRYEAEADLVALRATHDGAGMAALQRRLAVADLANPSPPEWAVLVLFDHPPVLDRIGLARAYASG
jgi:STE24 endopeptidase